MTLHRAVVVSSLLGGCVLVACDAPTRPADAAPLRSTELTPAARGAVGAYANGGETPSTSGGPLEHSAEDAVRPPPPPAAVRSPDAGGVAL